MHLIPLKTSLLFPSCSLPLPPAHAHAHPPPPAPHRPPHKTQVPLAAHQPKYNFSVWYVGLNGIQERAVVAGVAASYSAHSESNALRLILKHLRARGHFRAFDALLRSSRLHPPAPLPVEGARGGIHSASAQQQQQRPFEHPLLTNLFDSLVRRGAWDEAEAWLEKAAYGSAHGHGHGGSASSGAAAEEAMSASTTTASGQALFSEYLGRTLPKPIWEPIEPAGADARFPHTVLGPDGVSYDEDTRAQLDDGEDGDAPLAPGGRGGHQMCLDVENGVAYLFGGWDGQRDLADFWSYSLKDGRWRLLSADTRQQGGPGPRSCHKMCYCPRTGFIYVLGRFVDQEKQLEVAAHAAAAAAAAAAGGRAPADALPSLAASGAAGRGQSLIEALLSAHSASAAAAAAGAGAESTPRSHSPSAAAMAALHQNASPGGTVWEADFFRFSTRTGQWTTLSRDTAAEGGPKLIYDHQMLVDSESQLLYVFGGRVIHAGDPNRIDLSGMYRYDVIQRRWTFLFDDTVAPQSRIPSRVGHSMLLDQPPGGGPRQLWIMSGQRGDRYLTDMWRYNLATGKCVEVTRDAAAEGPHAGFTPRAAIDSRARELYYFTGFVQRRNTNERVRSAFWLYNMERNAWALIYEYGGLNSEVNKDHAGAASATLAITEATPTDADAMDEDAPMMGNPAALLSSPDNQYRSLGFDHDNMDEDLGGGSGGGGFFRREKEPRPRYAAQMVFDPKESCFYMFGGNPADFHAPSARLDDFWRLRLQRPSVADVLRQTRFLVRQQRFYEMAKSAKQRGGEYGGLASPAALQALTYLQQEVSAVVNHADEGESTVFRKLMGHLLSPPSAGREGGAGGGGGDSGVTSGNVSAEDVSSYGIDPLQQQHETPRVRPARGSAASSDGLEDLSDSEMLSISQVITQRESSGNSSSQLHFDEGQPTELFRQRTRLFNKLLNFFPADCTEPAAELSDAVGLLAARAPVRMHT